MATFKATMLFVQNSNKGGFATETRVGGWSESYYYQGDLNNLKGNFASLCVARAGILPDSARIVGQRYQSIDPPAAAGTAGRVFPGFLGSNDVPQLALFIRVPGIGVSNVRPLTLRGLPDAQCTDGEFAPTPTYKANLAFFLEQLSALTFRFKGTDKTQPQVGLETIGSDGTFTLQSNLTFTVGTAINVSRAKNSRGQTLEGRFRVLTATDATHGKFATWGDNGAWTGGLAQLDATIYPLVSDVSLNPGAKTVVRKVGRPFSGYRGRATRRML